MGQQSTYIPGREDETLKEFIGLQPVFIEITTPTIPGELLEIEHNLGRIPQGYSIVDRPFTMFNHGRDSTDTAWTEHFMYLRFSLAGTAMKIVVF